MSSSCAEWRPHVPNGAIMCRFDAYAWCVMDRRRLRCMTSVGRLHLMRAPSAPKGGDMSQCPPPLNTPLPPLPSPSNRYGMRRGEPEAQRPRHNTMLPHLTTPVSCRCDHCTGLERWRRRWDWAQRGPWPESAHRATHPNTHPGCSALPTGQGERGVGWLYPTVWRHSRRYPSVQGGE